MENLEVVKNKWKTWKLSKKMENLEVVNGRNTIEVAVPVGIRGASVEM